MTILFRWPQGVTKPDLSLIVGMALNPEKFFAVCTNPYRIAEYFSNAGHIEIDDPKIRQDSLDEIIEPVDRLSRGASFLCLDATVFSIPEGFISLDIDDFVCFAGTFVLGEKVSNVHFRVMRRDTVWGSYLVLYRDCIGFVLIKKPQGLEVFINGRVLLADALLSHLPREIVKATVYGVPSGIEVSLFGALVGAVGWQEQDDPQSVQFCLCVDTSILPRIQRKYASLETGSEGRRNRASACCYRFIEGG